MKDTADPVGTDDSGINKAKRTVREHPWGALGAVIGIVCPLVDVLIHHEITTSGVMGAFLGTVLYVIDVSTNAAERSKQNAELNREIVNSIETLGTTVKENTRVLRAHEQLLPSRTVDRLNLIAFKNLLAYLPFYLADDLGYLKEENIEISREDTSLDDRSTIELLHQNHSDSIAICDPYMCLSDPIIRMIYPICCGVAAWPMTLNWIGTAPPFPTVEGVTSAPASNKVLIASYQAPSTTFALAQLVAQRIVKPLLDKDATISPEVVQLDKKRASFGENDSREAIARGLKELLIGHNVVMLWEPHCEMAVRLGARYLSPSAYEASLRDYGESITYSAVVMSQTLIKTNPTLPIRLRRALDRASVRLQDPDRLAYCKATLDRRRLLIGLEDELRKDVLAKIVRNVPTPCDTQEIGATNWGRASWKWADGLFAADKLRQSLVRTNPNLAPALGVHTQHYSNSGDYRHLIYGGADSEG